MATPRRPAPSPVADELRAYFASGAADQGLSSSWAPLVGAALGGWGGSRDPEAGLVARVRLGPAARGPVAQARAVRGALAGLPADAVCVLWAAYGPVPWLRIVDQAFGRGMGQKVARRLGERAGVALLCPAVAAGLPAYLAGVPATAREAWRSAGGYVVSMCLAGDGGRVARVRDEAEAMVRAAEGAYAAARGAGAHVGVGGGAGAVNGQRRAVAGDRRRVAWQGAEEVAA